MKNAFPIQVDKRRPAEHPVGIVADKAKVDDIAGNTAKKDSKEKDIDKARFHPFLINIKGPSEAIVQGG